MSSLVDKLIDKPESATFADERQFWSIEKASNGQKYYFNKKTKESQWEKPECLKTMEERENQTDWIECTKSDGRIFFYNTQTKKSQWQIPPDLKLLRQQQAEKRRIREIQGLTEEDIDNGITDEQQKEIDQRNFLEMLREKKVTITTKWDQAQKLMQLEPRWLAIKQISEKKRLFQEYIQKVKRMEKQEQQNKTEKAKEDFFKLLEEQNLTSDNKFYRVASGICSDLRYRVLEEKSREAYFQEFLDKLVETEQETAKEDQKIHGDNLKKKIFNICQTSSSYKWSEFQQKFKDDQDFKKLNEYDRIQIFSDTMYEMEKAENEERRKNKRKNERNNRESFREMLKSKIAVGEINHKTKWKNFVQTIKDTPEFLNMLGQTGSMPHELFEDQQDLLIENHKAMKAEIKLHIKSSGMKVVADISYKEFIEKMKSLSVFDTLEEYLKNFYYHYFIQKAKLKEKETQKKHKKAQRKFLRFLKTLSELNKDSVFSKYEAVVTKGIGEEINAQIPQTEREEIFKEYVATLDPYYKDYDESANQYQDTRISANQRHGSHRPSSTSYQEPSLQKKQNTSRTHNNNEEDEEGEISEQERKVKNKSIEKKDEEHEEGEDNDSESEERHVEKDKKREKEKEKEKEKDKDSRRHRDHQSGKQKSKRSRSDSRQRSDKKNKKKDKDKKKKRSHKESRSKSGSR